MDQSTLNIAAGAVMACLGWFARMLWERQEAHSRELADIRVHVAGNFVTNDRLAEVMGELKGDLRYIRERFDGAPQRRHGDPQ